MPARDTNYSSRWRLIKSLFTRALAAQGIAANQNAKGEYNVWQSRFWEHTIRNDEDYRRHVDYVHYNPVKHGYVASVKDWRHSSFHRYVAAGRLPIDWAGEEVGDRDYGE